MKQLIFFSAIISLFSCFSCKKSPGFDQSPSGKPSVFSVSFSPVFAGGSESVKFDVTLNIVGEVAEVNLYRLPSLKVWTVTNPVTKSYIMYDHTSATFPTWASSTFYQFEFVMKSGEKILLDKFQVY